MAGNAAVARLVGSERQLLRAPGGPSSPVPVKRVVFIDGNVLDQINRGNKAMAQAMLKMKASGTRMVMGESVEKEFITNVSDKQMHSAHQAMVRDFGIEMNPADLHTSAAQRAPYAKELRANLTGIKDTEVAAEAMAAHAELMTIDVTYRKNPKSVAKIKELRMAPESGTEIVRGNIHWNYAEGRELLDLEPITVGADGSVVRGVKPPAVGKVVRGGHAREVVHGSRPRGEVGVKAEGGAAGPKTTSGPTVTVEDPGLRGQATSGKTTEHVPSGTTVTGEIGPRGKGGGSKAKGGGAPAKTEKAAVKAEGAALKAEGAALKAESAAVRAEGTLVKGVRYGAAAGRVAKAASVVAEFVPGPLDAILLIAQFAAVYKENRARDKGDGLRWGFPKGLAARLVFAPANAWKVVKSDIGPRSVDASVLKQVAGTVGAWEKGAWLGLKAGIEYGDRISPDQRKKYIAAALHGIRELEGSYYSPQDAEHPEDTWYTSNNVYNLGRGLRKTTDAILDEQEAIDSMVYALKLQTDPYEQAKALWELVVGSSDD